MSPDQSCFYAACGAHHGVDNHPPACQPGEPPEGAYVCDHCRHDLAARTEPYVDEQLAHELAAKTVAMVAVDVYRDDIVQVHSGDPRVAEFDAARLEKLESRVLELAHTVTLNPTWPDGDTQIHPAALVADARAVAELCRSIFAEMPVGLDELFGDAWDQLPDWFTDQPNGRALWHTDLINGEGA